MLDLGAMVFLIDVNGIDSIPEHMPRSFLNGSSGSGTNNV